MCIHCNYAIGGCQWVPWPACAAGAKQVKKWIRKTEKLLGEFITFGAPEGIVKLLTRKRWELVGLGA